MEMPMTHIDEERLESDLGYRFPYLTDFMDFGAGDVTAIHAADPPLAPLVPNLVEAVYQKLAGYDSTWRHFLPRQSGYDGEIADDLAAVTQDHPQIRYRKEHLARYLAS